MLDVSVIVPVYQVADYLEQCLQSLLQQSWKNFEVLLIDDGSTDGSAEICDAFAGRDPRFKVIHQTNQGVGAVRNVGLSKAQGAYIAFVDGDDYVAPDMLEKMLQSAREAKADLLICDYFTLSGDQTEYKKQLPHEQIWRDDSFMQYVANEKILSFPWNKLYRKELFTEIRYPLGMVFEYQYIFHRLARKAKAIAYSNGAYYYYRINPDGLSRSLHTRNAYDCFTADLERQRFMQEYYPQYADGCWTHIINNACNTYWRYLFTGEGQSYAQETKAYLQQRAGRLLFSSQVSLNAKIKILTVFLKINKLKWQRMLRKRG